MKYRVDRKTFSTIKAARKYALEVCRKENYASVPINTDRGEYVGRVSGIGSPFWEIEETIMTPRGRISSFTKYDLHKDGSITKRRYT